MRGPRRGVIALLAAFVVGGLVVGGAAPHSTISGTTATKRCHYVVKGVRGKKKRVRVCRKASADVRLALAIEPAPPLSPGQTPVTFSVQSRTEGPTLRRRRTSTPYFHPESTTSSPASAAPAARSG